jgi:hypothetical protein
MISSKLTGAYQESEQGRSEKGPGWTLKSDLVCVLILI